MKELFQMIIILIFSYFNTSAQQLIVVQSGSNNLFYNNLDTAIKYSRNGDTIYLPGGSFSLSTGIDKRLTIVGVGHNPNSTMATDRTIINGRLTINTGADNGSVTGVYFSPTYAYFNLGQIFFNSNVKGYSISRCHISGGISNGQNTDVQNILIFENVIGSGNSFSISLNSPNQYISNNIILSRVHVHNSLLQNNIFLFYNSNVYSPYSLYSSNCTVENNIFYVFSSSENRNSIFRNNINGGVNGVDGNGNQGNTNFAQVSIDTIFINYNHSSGWSYSSNFHLRNNSPYHNAGTDATDIGIYGGTFPWKEGSIPFNPHISSKNIDAQNDPNGNIRVRIKVKAQSN